MAIFAERVVIILLFCSKIWFIDCFFLTLPQISYSTKHYITY